MKKILLTLAGAILVGAFDCSAIVALKEADHKLAPILQKMNLKAVAAPAELSEPQYEAKALINKIRQKPKPKFAGEEEALVAAALAQVMKGQQLKQATACNDFVRGVLTRRQAEVASNPTLAFAARKYLDQYEALIPLYAKPARVKEIATFLPELPGRPPLRIENRKLWTNPLITTPNSNTVARAEKIVKEAIVELPDSLYNEFMKNGNRSHFEDKYFLRVNNLSTLLMAECLENKGRFLAKIEDYINAISSETCWCVPSHVRATADQAKKIGLIDLFSSARALTFARVYDVLGDKLSVATREKIKTQVMTRVLNQFFKDLREPKCNSRDWWYMGDNNWNAVVNSCCVRAALLIVDSREMRAECVESLERTTPYFLGGFLSDGYCTEGAAYWNYGFGHHLMGAAAVRIATKGKVNIVQDPKNKLIMAYPYAYIVDGTKRPNFADGGGKLQLAFLKLGRTFWPDLTSAEAEETPVTSFGFDSIDVFLNEGYPAKVKGAKDVRAMRSVFDEAQVYIFRPEPNQAANRLAVAFKGGNNDELHNHNDLGSYEVVVDGVHLVQDPGPEKYTGRTFSSRRYESDVLNSYGHSVPRINESLQPAGKQFVAKILKKTLTENQDEVVVDLRGAYALKSLTKLERTFTYNRKGGVFTVTDQFEATEPLAFEVPLVTYATVQVGENGEIALEAEGKRLQAEVTASGAFDLKGTIVNRQPWASPRRVACVLKESAKRGFVTFTYRIPRAADDALKGMADLKIEKPTKTRFVMLKLDDLVNVNGKVNPRITRVANYLKGKNLKGSFGVIVRSIENKPNTEYVDWIKQNAIENGGLFEVWNHGWDHAMNFTCKEDDACARDKRFKSEFATSLEHQRKNLARSLDTFKKWTGLEMHTLGTAGNAGTPDTLKALKERPEIKVWLFGNQRTKSPLILMRSANLEYTVGKVSFEAFQKAYATSNVDYFVLQGHPAMWDDQMFAEFKKIVEFLESESCRFVTPYEYAKFKGAI